jgi:hypothetical protein
MAQIAPPIFGFPSLPSGRLKRLAASWRRRRQAKKMASLLEAWMKEWKSRRFPAGPLVFRSSWEKNGAWFPWLFEGSPPLPVQIQVDAGGAIHRFARMTLPGLARRPRVRRGR